MGEIKKSSPAKRLLQILAVSTLAAASLNVAKATNHFVQHTGLFQSTQYKVIDPAQVDFTNASWAQKTAKIIATPAIIGERVDTIMKNGHVETTHIAKEGDMKITNPSGEQYLVSAEKFNQRYKPTDQPNVFSPKAAPIRVLRVKENVQFTAPWGETMKIKAGGYLACAGPGDVYGIQPREFAETYSFVKGSRPAPTSRISQKGPGL